MCIRPKHIILLFPVALDISATWESLSYDWENWISYLCIHLFLVHRWPEQNIANSGCRDFVMKFHNIIVEQATKTVCLCLHFKAEKEWLAQDHPADFMPKVGLEIVVSFWAWHLSQTGYVALSHCWLLVTV